MPLQIKIKPKDLRAWQDALAQYAAITHRTLAEVAVIKAREVFYYASAHLQRTHPSDFGTQSRGTDLTRGDPSTCALVAWLLRKKADAGKIAGLGFTDFRTGKTIARQYAGRGKSKGKIKTEYLRRGARYYTRAYARQWARQQTRVRRSHRKFILILPIKAAQAIAERAKRIGIDIPLGKSPKRPAARQLAVDGTATAVTIRQAGARTAIALTSTYRFRSPQSLAGQPIDRTARDYQAMIDAALPAGLRASLRNIQSYLARKYAQLAKKSP